MDRLIGKVTIGVTMKTIMQVVNGTEEIAAVIMSELTTVHLVNVWIQISFIQKLLTPIGNHKI